MKILASALFVFALVSCGGSSGKRPTGGSCTPTPEGATNCEGLECLMLDTNQQGKAGICTASCTTSTDCGQGNLCVDVNGNGQCARTCTQNSDCIDGFVCVADAGGDQICFSTQAAATVTKLKSLE
jgi:hypothetical protein